MNLTETLRSFETSSKVLSLGSNRSVAHWLSPPHTQLTPNVFVMPRVPAGCSAGQGLIAHLPSTCLPPVPFEGQPITEGLLKERTIFMVLQNLNVNSQPQNSIVALPRELRSVIAILEADVELKTKALPLVDLQKFEINWNEIFKKDFSLGQRAALIWAKALFQGRRPMKADPFDRATSMDMNLRRAVLTALEINWGLGQ